METVTTVCEACDGRRYNDDVLHHRLDGPTDEGGTGPNVADILAMPVDDALGLFTAKATRVPAAAKVLQQLHDVGLGYIRIGQPLSTLSGGERQRLKLAVHLGEDGDVIVLDEPTVGLHLADVEAMLAMLDHLIEAGRSVVVIEHHQAVMAHADWIIDMGPGAGHDGGRVVFTGTPAQLVEDSRSGRTTSVTGEYLARYLSGE